MVMQWTVNPPPSGTPGSIPGYSTNLYRVGFLGRSSALQAEETGSIPVRDASYTIESTWG